MNIKKIVRLAAQVLTSASLISAGIMAGVTPVGATLGFTGFFLAFPMEEETNEEYNAQVRAHFEGCNDWRARWALRGAK